MHTNPYIRLDRALKDAKKHGDSVFLCYSCAEAAKPTVACLGGRLIASTEPTVPCGICREPNSRLEFRG